MLALEKVGSAGSTKALKTEAQILNRKAHA